ncbi:hypothetical protein TNCV_2781101 [Trichonephila clavipes]|nr:hypothetical protein TNCV_2781101 [Trichonephila clavipes]
MSVLGFLTFELLTEITYIASLQDRSSEVLGLNSRHVGHESLTLTTAIPFSAKDSMSRKGLMTTAVAKWRILGLSPTKSGFWPPAEIRTCSQSGFWSPRIPLHWITAIKHFSSLRVFDFLSFVTRSSVWLLCSFEMRRL